MNMQKYYRIGAEVKYIRHDTDLKVHEESGVIRAIFVDPQNRLMVQVKNGENAHNVHYAVINYDKSMVKKYKKLLQDIRATSDEGDKIVQDVVEEYNQRVQDVTSEVLGAALVADVMNG